MCGWFFSSTFHVFGKTVLLLLYEVTIKSSQYSLIMLKGKPIILTQNLIIILYLKTHVPTF